MTADISRHPHRPTQRYRGVTRQTGRLAIEADGNEADEIETAALRSLVTDAICAKGTADNGYQISGVSREGDGAFTDFAVSPGTFYLGGLRVESESGNSYRSQPDWLAQSLDSPATPPSNEATGPRSDLVWLHAWSQSVSGVEDAELLDPALGGPDTAARTRTMHRVRVTPDVPNDCEDAVRAMIETTFPGGILDDEQCSVISPTELTIGFSNIGVTDDLCRPSAAAGYLGANNETFRVRITEPGRFVWGRDNASAMHRVQVETDDGGQRRRIRLLTPPRDEHGWPLTGQTVEILRWGALLDNGEKVAEPSGLLLSVVGDYDPVEQTLTVDDDVPLAWDTWFTGEGAGAISDRDDDDLNTYFYMRIWTGGGDGAAADNPFVPGVSTALGETGLLATFSDRGLADDYWVLAARPNTPTEILPWALLDGERPHGPERLIAPLALLQWNDNDVLEPTDCRHRFRPLCRVGGCSLVTVGDGRISHGDVTSIQEAIDLLPDEGGEVCIHPGEYAEHVRIDARQNITITGCGRNTRWTGAGIDAPLIHIRNSSGVTIRRLSMAGGPVTAIESNRPSRNVTVTEVGFECSDASAVFSQTREGLTVTRCMIDLLSMSAPLSGSVLSGRIAAIFAAGQRIRIEHCTIQARGLVLRPTRPYGGIHIGGPSYDVHIENNIIRDGNGHGITLGSIQYVRFDDGFESGGVVAETDNVPWTVANVSDRAAAASPLTIFNDCPDLAPAPVDVADPDDNDGPLVPISRGGIADLVIANNRIERVGYSGVSAQFFLGLGPAPTPSSDSPSTSPMTTLRAADSPPTDSLAISRTRIYNNVIERCMQNPIGERSVLSDLFSGWGGIALSRTVDLVIRDNTIFANGAVRGDPISGIFLAIAEDVRIERNRIEANGVERGAPTDASTRHAGVSIAFAVGGQASVSSSDVGRAVDRPALVVTNNMVDAPAARALQATTLGPTMVLGNRLVGAGRSRLFTDPIGSLITLGAVISRNIFASTDELDLTDIALLNAYADVLGGDAVSIFSMGMAEDIESMRRRANGPGVPPLPDPSRLRGGELAFNDNQISFRQHGPETASSLSSVLLFSGDDISYANNQTEVENDVQLALINLLAIGATMRVTANRFQEPYGRTFLSMATLGTHLNNTSDNQSTHCLFVSAPAIGRVERDNRTIIGLTNPELCGGVAGAARNASENLTI